MKPGNLSTKPKKKAPSNHLHQALSRALRQLSPHKASSIYRRLRFFRISISLPIGARGYNSLKIGFKSRLDAVIIMSCKI